MRVNEWVRHTVGGLFGAGGEQQRRQSRVLGLHTQEGRCIEQRGVTWCKVKPKEGHTPGH